MKNLHTKIFPKIYVHPSRARIFRKVNLISYEIKAFKCTVVDLRSNMRLTKNKCQTMAVN